MKKIDILKIVDELNWLNHANMRISHVLDLPGEVSPATKLVRTWFWKNKYEKLDEKDGSLICGLGSVRRLQDAGLLPGSYETMCTDTFLNIRP